MKKRCLSIALCVVFVLSVFALPAGAYKPYEAKYAPGDVNNSGEVAASDALLALQGAVGKIELDYDEQDAADVNYDWAVTASDALAVLQNAVGKIELTAAENVYDSYELKYVEPTGLKENTYYQVSSGTCFKDASGKDYDFCRLMVCMQGLINRNNDKHHVVVGIRMDNTDDAWRDFMMEDGAYYSSYKDSMVKVTTTEEMLDTFKEFMNECGIIAWDPDVPSTANVASTICGLYNYLPVQYSTKEDSVYQILTKQYEIPVKMSLVGMFEDAKIGGKIADTNLSSTGSAKNDAYIWAMDKYMSECNPETMAYTLDGASSVEGNSAQTSGEGYSANITGIPNHDYFILNQCFFFDLTSFSGETPSDDPNQPLGTDSGTLKTLLNARYELSGGQMGMVVGFPPWHVKYTNFKSIGGSLDPARLEWHFVETCVSYNCGIEADAANPCWMSNGSLYTKYQMRYTARGNTPADETITYDPDTYYWTQCYAGDFDCSPWLKSRAWQVWNDENLGNVKMTFNYSTTLINRIPQVFDFIYSKQTGNEYFTAGEGSAYVMTSALFEGFKGKEANPTTRVLPDGDRAYVHYLKPYLDSAKIDIYGMLINGFSVAGANDMKLMSYLAPNGGLFQNSTAGSHNVHTYNGTPYIRVGGIGGDNNEMRSILLRSTIKGADSHFTAVGYFNPGDNAGTPTNFKEFMDYFNDYISWAETKKKIQFVDIETFFKLLSESGRGYNVLTGEDVK